MRFHLPTGVSRRRGLSQEDVDQLTTKFLSRWADTPGTLPPGDMQFSPEDQRQNELDMDRDAASLPASVPEYEAMSGGERAGFRDRIRATVAGLPFLPPGVLDDRFVDATEEATWRFVKRAREFDAGMTEGDLHQALRNLWVFHCVQLLVGVPVRGTDSSFAYSLLYPYTDNRLDSSEQSMSEQAAMVHWLSSWFRGEEIPCADSLTAKVARLLLMIENECPRTKYPELFESMGAIHRAQWKGVVLRRKGWSAQAAELLSATMEKGGTSVLVDAFLTGERLDARQIEAFFGFGVFLQLVDDLQDLEEDWRAGQVTPLLGALKEGRLVEMVCRLLRFGDDVASIMGKNAGSHGVPVRDFLRRCFLLLVAGGVARHRALYPEEFVKVLEGRIPVTCEFLDRAQRKAEGTIVRDPGGMVEEEATGRCWYAGWKTHERLHLELCREATLADAQKSGYSLS
jgi:hypothetical protein